MAPSRKQPIDIFLEILGILIVLASFILPSIYYQSLPDSIPRHFGSDGKPDAYGSKGVIWILPIVGIILFLVVGLISNIPGLINLPFKPNPEKMENYQIKYARMIRILNVCMVCLFGFVTYKTIQIGLGNETQLPGYFAPATLLFLIAIPIIYVLPDLIKARKLK